jgi:glutathione S-transferase
MDGAELQHVPVNLQNPQAAPLHCIAPETSLGSQLTTSFDPNDPQTFQAFQAFPSAIGNIQQHHIQTARTFVRPPRPGEPPNNLFGQQRDVAPRRQQLPGADSKTTNNGNGQFPASPPHLGEDTRAVNPQANHNQLIPHGQVPASHSLEPQDDQLELLQALQQPLQSHTIPQIQKNAELPLTEPAAEKPDGHFRGMKMIPDPPDLQLWREKLFNVNEMITLTEEEYVPRLTI